MKYIKLFEDLDEDGYEEISPSTYSEELNNTFFSEYKSKVQKLFINIGRIKSISDKGYSISINKLDNGNLYFNKSIIQGESIHSVWVYILPDEYYLVASRLYQEDDDIFMCYKCDQMYGLQKLLEDILLDNF